MPGEVDASPVVLPDRTFSSAAVVDLGDRVLELVHPGRAHTSGDLVVRVADADVLVAGDLVEESGPPAYGPDSFPMEWPLALDVCLQLCTDRTVVVPGHGAPVDRAFVMDQRADIGVVAETSCQYFREIGFPSPVVASGSSRRWRSATGRSIAAPWCTRSRAATSTSRPARSGCPCCSPTPPRGGEAGHRAPT